MGKSKSDDLKITVLPTIPVVGTLYYCDVVEIEVNGEAFVRKYQGTRYRAAKEGEEPTHHPKVRNSEGFMGFVVDSPQ